MQKLYIHIGLSIACALTMWGCDVVDAPYRERPVDPSDTTKVVRNILIEDFTGFKCPNCPAAADIAKDLKDVYGKQLYVISIHAGSYAKPDPVGAFTYDFRNETSTDLAAFFGVPQYPNGMVSRIVPDGGAGRMLDAGQWSRNLPTLVSSEADLKIAIDNEYNEATRSLTVDIDLDYVNAQGTDNYLSVYIVEDSIVQPQIDNRRPPDQQKILDYVHNHVLRGAVNGKWWGERLSETAIAAGAKLNRKYTIALKEGWKPEHCEIIAFVHRYDPTYSVANSTPGEFEILQVEGLGVMK